jgi:hypothetical protein
MMGGEPLKRNRLIKTYLEVNDKYYEEIIIQPDIYRPQLTIFRGNHY